MPDDYSSNTQTTGTVAVGHNTTGEIESYGDIDWLAVTLEEGKTYQIDLTGSVLQEGVLYNPYLSGIYDADGNFLPGTKNDNGGPSLNSRLYFTATLDATYYVAAAAYNGAGKGTYTLSVSDPIEDDFAAGTETSGVVAVGGSVDGNIELPRDRDWFAVTLEANKVYRIDLEGSETGAHTLSDPHLRGVYDADGNFLPGTKNDNGGKGNNSLVSVTPTQDGTYYVAAGAHGTGRGTYKLSVREIVDDFAAGTETSGVVAVDGSVTGEIELPLDRDWFAVILEKDKVYRVDLKGSETQAGTLSDPYLRGIHDADGNRFRAPRTTTAARAGTAGHSSRRQRTAPTT